MALRGGGPPSWGSLPVGHSLNTSSESQPARSHRSTSQRLHDVQTVNQHSPVLLAGHTAIHSLGGSASELGLRICVVRNCVGWHRFAQVCAGMHRFARVLPGFARVRTGLRGFARACAGWHGFRIIACLLFSLLLRD